MNTHNLKPFVKALLAVVLVGAVSCRTDLLDPQPKTHFPASIVFDTPQRVEQQVNGLYDAVKNGYFLGARLQVYLDVRGEDFINRNNNGVTGLQTWNHTVVESTNEVNNVWAYGYQAINQVNVFLQDLEANASKFVAPTFAENYATVQVPQYQAEARFLRAVSYFYLLQLYARPYIDGNGSRPGLPLRLNAETGFDNNDMPRSTVAQVYEQILNDLNFAEQNLPVEQTEALRVNRAHQNAAIAFKTRVYLAMSQWNEVIREADKIVSQEAPFRAATGNRHELSPSIAAVFAPPQRTLESIFSLPYTNQDAPTTQSQIAYYYLPATRKVAGDPTGNGEYFLNPSGIVANQGWKATDARRAFLIPAASGTNLYLNKYPTGAPYTDQVPVIRYAEVLLNLAEAITRSTNAVEPRAIALLNAVRGRSDPSTQFTTADFPTATALADAILTERRIEFMGEGMRSNDLMRLNLTIPGKGTVPAVNPTDPNYVWPIPAVELSANTVIERN